jgi:hypothetical protein
MFVAINEAIAKGGAGRHRFKRNPRTSAISPDFGHIAASHRSATKSADARRGATHDGELRQAAGAAAAKGMIACRPSEQLPGNALSIDGD